MPASMKLDGAPIEPAKRLSRHHQQLPRARRRRFYVAFRVDGPKQTGVYDDEALFAFFQANSPIAPRHRPDPRID